MRFSLLHSLVWSRTNACWLVLVPSGTLIGTYGWHMLVFWGEHSCDGAYTDHDRLHSQSGDIPCPYRVYGCKNACHFVCVQMGRVDDN